MHIVEICLFVITLVILFMATRIMFVLQDMISKLLTDFSREKFIYERAEEFQKTSDTMYTKMVKLNDEFRQSVGKLAYLHDAINEVSSNADSLSNTIKEAKTMSTQYVASMRDIKTSLSNINQTTTKYGETVTKFVNAVNRIA